MPKWIAAGPSVDRFGSFCGLMIAAMVVEKLAQTTLHEMKLAPKRKMIMIVETNNLSKVLDQGLQRSIYAYIIFVGLWALGRHDLRRRNFYGEVPPAEIWGFACKVLLVSSGFGDLGARCKPRRWLSNFTLQVRGRSSKTFYLSILSNWDPLETYRSFAGAAYSE